VTRRPWRQAVLREKSLSNRRRHRNWRLRWCNLSRAEMHRVRHFEPRPNGTPSTPEQAAIFREREDLIKKVLSELSDRDREILTRFYLKEQSESKICLEMVLTETQFRLLKSRAKARFGDLGKKKLVGRKLDSVPVRYAAAHT
jgi:DNA-directed RNA polymerase specialized sigma24 family protein